MSSPVLVSLARSWRRLTLTRELLRCLGVAALGSAGVLLWGRLPWVEPCLMAGFAVFIVRLLTVRPWRIGSAHVADHLDRTHPELEESCGLLRREPGSLTPTERLQRQRLDAAWAKLKARGVHPGEVPPGSWRGARGVFIAGGLTLLLAGFWRSTHPHPAGAVVGSPSRFPPAAVGPSPGANPRPRLVGAELTVVPPAYTGRPPRMVAGLDAEVEEGATVTWSVRMEGPTVGGMRLVFGEGEGPQAELRATGPAATWEGSRVAGTESQLYHLAVRPPAGPESRLPEIGSLKVLRDGPPSVTILQPPVPRLELDPAVSVSLPVEVQVSDDYGVGDARLVATIAKGSGEGVKFRERTLEFDPPAATGVLPSPREKRFATTLNLAALGMEPGDELYFHVEASDNHLPAANRTRSETRFVVLRGPAAAPATFGRGMTGVNLVPEYFRSQRQIIIDTERLLADRPGLSEPVFRRRADDLGADQGLLRLRYGQFVGEENEAGAGGGGDHTEVALNPLRPGVPGGVPSDLVHQHDRGVGEGATVNDPRAGLRTAMRLRLEHAEQARGGGEGHDDAPAVPDTGLPPTPGQILAPYVDQHDSQDKATFFDQGTKATLRGALEAMWKAEGLLRTARPEEALTPEHQALDMLKELQQGERLYVQRVGFEPAPLRITERRGRGDLGDVPARAASPGAGSPPEDPGQAAVRAAVADLPGGSDDASRRLTPAERESLRHADGPLGKAAAREPDRFLAALRALHRLEDGENLAAGADLAAVRSALLRLLPPAGERPTRSTRPGPEPGRAGDVGGEWSGEGARKP